MPGDCACVRLGVLIGWLVLGSRSRTGVHHTLAHTHIHILSEQQENL